MMFPYNTIAFTFYLTLLWTFLQVPYIDIENIFERARNIAQEVIGGLSLMPVT